MLRQLATLLSVCAVVLWACASGAGGGSADGGSADGGSAGGSSPGGSSGGDDEFTLPSGSKPIPQPSLTVTGTLGFDDIEGGCAFIEAADGKRYEVIYPEGWSVDQSNVELRGPDGQVAHAGDSVTVRGSVATNRSSICQIGPIFAATSVEISPD